MKTKILSLMLIASSIFLFSCKEEEEFTSGKLKQSNVTLNVGESAQLEYSGIGVTWESGDTQIASVTDDGVVTGVHVGKTTLRANWSTCEVNVKSKNNFYVDPIIEDFDIKSSGVSAYFAASTVSYSKNGSLSYNESKTSFELSELGDNFIVYDANVTNGEKSENLNFYSHLSPEYDSEVKDASIKSVLRYLYMLEKNSTTNIAAIAMVVEYSNKEFLFDYLYDRYNVVSDSDSEEKEFKSIDGNIVVKTIAIDDQTRDKNYNYTVFKENAYAVAMIVPNNAESDNVMEELKKGVIESYLRGTYTISYEVFSEKLGEDDPSEYGYVSIKDIDGKELENGEMIKYGKVILSATANDGYKFVGYGTLDAGKPKIESYYKNVDTITVAAAVNYFAFFEKPFEVKVSTKEGGSATISLGEEPGKTSLNVTKYEVVTFNAEPAEGYKFVNWTDVEGNEISNNSTKATFSESFTGAVEYVANFAIATYNVEVKLEGEGNIAGKIDNGGEEKIALIFDSEKNTLKNDDATEVKYGDKITLTATEEETSDYIFAGWQQDEKIISTDKEYTITATSDIQMVALYKKKEVNVEVKAGEGGTVSPSSKKVEIGSTLKIEAKPKTGYKFEKWVSKDGETISTENPYEPIITGDTEFRALFSVKDYNVSISVSGEGSIRGALVKDGKESDELFVDGNNNSIAYGDTIKLSVTNIDESFLFTGWKLDKNIVSKDLEFTTKVSGDAAYTAVFEKKAYYLKITAEEGGKIEGKDYERVEYGKTTTFKIKADAEYELAGLFANGEEIMSFKDLGQTEYSYTTDPIYKNVNYTVTFAKVKYDVAVVAGEGGVITSDEQIKVTSGEQTTIQAKAAEGYRFVNWTVGGEEVSKSNPYTTAPITESKTYVANFEKL